MRAVSSGTGGTGCGRGSDMGALWTRKSSNAMAPHKAADFANGVRSVKAFALWCAAQPRSTVAHTSGTHAEYMQTRSYCLHWSYRARCRVLLWALGIP